MQISSKKSGNLCKEKFAAFDFSKEDESIEKCARKRLAKFKNSKKSKFNSPIDKYKFLECFTGQPEFVRSNSAFEPIDVDASDVKMEEPTCRWDSIAECSVSNDYKSDIKTTQIYNSDVPVSVEHIADQHAERITRFDNNVLSGLSSYVSGAKRSEDTILDCKNSNIDRNWSLVDRVPITVDSDDDRSVENKLSVSDSKFAQCGGLSGDGPSGVEAKLTDPLGVQGMTVSIAPDSLYYGGTCSLEASLTFSSQGIRLEASNYFGTRRSFEVEWAISEIVSIESIHCESLAEIILHLKSIDTHTDGVTKINFVVSDPNWAQREEAIRSLHRRYKVCWNVIDSYTTSKEDSGIQSVNQISNQYLVKESRRFIVYPKGDPDAVLVSERDIELLLPERFINDTIIDFYIKYISNRIRPPERQRFHFFNSFFFRKLADLDKDSSRVHEGTVDFQHVRKWTKNVDLFAKDFIFIPVNVSLHWSLIIICHPGEVPKSEDELQNFKVPCILHMDSIRGSHRGFETLFQSYLLEEWKERHDIEAGNISEKFGRLPFISLELPQQQNSFDCGLFLLHYVERFLEMISVNLNAFNLAEQSSFPQSNWFPPAEASEKRVLIRKLIYGIFESDPLEDPVLQANAKCSTSDSIEQNISTGSSLEKNDEKEVDSCADPEFISDEGVHITSRKDTPLRIPHSLGKSSPVFVDIEQEVQSVTNMFNELPTVEEDREVGGQMYPLTEETHFQRSAKVVDLLASPAHEASSAEHTSVPDCEMLSSSPETSTCLVPESENLVTDEDDEPFDVYDEQFILVSPSSDKANDPSDMELESYVIEDSEVED